MWRKRLVFPFSAIVGLDELKLAILINAINPKVGGLLIRGPKGSGKSTVVRALADILPKISVVKDCPFNCNPYDPSNMCQKCRERYASGENLPIEERGMAVIDLPLGSTEDRVVGSLDVEKAIKYGIEALEPGILAEANQNILYVDEVNLLPDHIADDLLDAAATGWNIVEREGISVSHPSRFIFVGTMNPEEGELRPQLLDRFPLSVTVERITSAEDRMEIVRRNMEFEADPEKFYEKYRLIQEELRNKIVQARKVLENVVIPDGLLETICKTCLELKVDGLRPDIVIAKAASTLAAFENRREVNLNDVLVAAKLALSHRTREGGFLEPATPQEITDVLMATAKKVFRFEKAEEEKAKAEKRRSIKGRAFFWIMGDAFKEEEERLGKDNFINRIMRMKAEILFRLNALLRLPYFAFGRRLRKKPEGAPVINGFLMDADKLRGELLQETVKEKVGGSKAIPLAGEAPSQPRVFEGLPIVKSIEEKKRYPSKIFFNIGRVKVKVKKRIAHVGKRAQAVTALHRGKPYGWKFPRERPTDIHLPATIREAARKQKMREGLRETAVKICFQDIREKLRLYRAPVTMVFVVDLSGSMLLNVDAMREALLKLHGDAYRLRDRVGIVALKDTGAVVVQHPTTNLEVIARKLLDLRVSGFTPLAAGMLKAWEVLKEERRRNPFTIPIMVIITDGNANVPLKRSIETGEVRQIEEVKIIVREYEDVAIRDAISVSKMIKRDGIRTIVINTNPRVFGRGTYGTAVTKLIASITNGSHYIIGQFATDRMVENVMERIAEDRMAMISESVLKR